MSHTPYVVIIRVSFCASLPENAASGLKTQPDAWNILLANYCMTPSDASQILPDDVPAYTEMEEGKNYRFRVHQDEYPDVERVRDIRCESDEHSYRKRMEKSDDGQWVCPECGAAVSIRS